MLSNNISNYLKRENVVDLMTSIRLVVADINELQEQVLEWEDRLGITGTRLARCVRARDRLRRQQKRLCAAFTIMLRHISKCLFVTNDFT